MKSDNNLIKYFQELSYRHNLWDIYSDFLELAATSIRCSVDFIFRSKGEKRYKEIMNKYSDKEKVIFPKILGALTVLLEDPKDYLGEAFMELELGSKWKGQFFTPYNLCLLTAELSLDGVDKKIKEKGYVTLNEPSCGGGAMVIAVAQVMKKKGFNYQKQLKVIAQDLDIKAVYMSYIQLSLLGISAQVVHANTLSLEVFDVWETPFYKLNGFKYKVDSPLVEIKTEKTDDIKQIDGQLRLVI